MTTEAEATRDRLLRALHRERPLLEKNDKYFEGEQPLKFLAPILQEQLGFRLSPIVINLARYVVDVYDTRSDITGFRFAGQETTDDELWQVFEHNDGQLQAQQANRESLALGRAYAIVGEGDDDVPLLTVESPFDAIHENNPRTHEVENGIKAWTELDGTRRVTLYNPDGSQTWYRGKTGGWKDDGDPEENGFRLCRLVPLVNEPRTLGRLSKRRYDQRLGRSVFHDLIPLMDALNKIASDMMVSAEFHALPRRYATGLNEDDFMGEDGKPIDTFSLIAGRMWGTESEKAKFGQFPEAELTNFHNTMKILVQQAAMLVALPPHYTTFTGDNPASADAIRSAESPLVKRVERKNMAMSAQWERVQRLVLLTLGYDDSPEARTIETIWADPSTPTVAQKADAISKLVSTKDGRGRSLVPIEKAREDMGYSPAEQARMRDWDLEASGDPEFDAAMKKLQDAAAGV